MPRIPDNEIERLKNEVSVGGPIDWVMKSRSVSFRHAVELLKADPSLGVAHK